MNGTLSGKLDRVRDRAIAAGVFGEVQIEGNRLVCAARASAEPAFYRVDQDAQGVWVSLVTDNRWLSESIESDLMHSGDKMEELLDEELVEQGFEGGPLSVQHFRSEDMLFTFRSRVPLPEADEIARVLLAYEACFSQLGDMEADEDD